MFSLDEEMESDVGTGLKTFRAPEQTPLRVAAVQFPSRIEQAQQAARKRGETDLDAIAAKLREKVAIDKSKEVDDLKPLDLLDLETTGFEIEKCHQIKRGSRKINVVSRIGKDGADSDAVWQKHGGPTIDRVALLLLVYPTNQEHVVDEAQLDDQISNGRLVLQVLQMTSDRFNSLKKFSSQARAAGSSLAKTDFLIKVGSAEDGFDLIFRGVGNAVWRKTAEREKAVLQAALALYPQVHAAQTWTTEELQARFLHETDVGTFGGL